METTGQPGPTTMPSTRQRLRRRPDRLDEHPTVDPGLPRPCCCPCSSRRSVSQITVIGTGGAQLLALTALVALLAVAARVTGTFGVARWTSLERHEVRTICALVCARGATELVMPNVGANLRLLPAALYTPAVLMALITTVLSSVLTRSSRLNSDRAERVPASQPAQARC